MISNRKRVMNQCQTDFITSGNKSFKVLKHNYCKYSGDFCQQLVCKFRDQHFWNLLRSPREVRLFVLLLKTGNESNSGLINLKCCVNIISHFESPYLCATILTFGSINPTIVTAKI